MTVFQHYRRLIRVRRLFTLGAITNKQAIRYLMPIADSDMAYAKYIFEEFVCH